MVIQDKRSATSFFMPFTLALVAAILFLPGLGARDFWAPGEPIYAEVIRVMFEKNDWLVPTLNDQLFADKPVLYYWLALIVSKLMGGVSEWTVRIPEALGAIGLVLTVYIIGTNFFDQRSGFLAGLILATTNRVFWESRFLRFDCVLSLFLLLGFYFFLRAFINKESRAFYLAAYACFALATLTKGPLGLVLPGLAALGLLAFSRQWTELRKMQLLTGILLVLAIIVPWLIALHFKGHDQWVRDFLLIHNLQNYALEPIGHIRPFYYYLLSLPVDFLPWTLLLPSALIYYYPWRERLRSPATLAWVCWFAATFFFFTASKSKIAYYLLPLLPAVALLLGCYLNALLSEISAATAGTHRILTRASFYLLAAVFFAGGIALPIVSHKIEPGIFNWSLALALIWLVGASVTFVALRKRDLKSVLGVLVLVLVTSLFIGGIEILPYMDRYKSPRPLAEFVKRNVPDAAPVYVFRSPMADFNYYAERRKIIPIESPEEIDKLISDVQPMLYLIINAKDMKYLSGVKNIRRVTQKQIGDKLWLLTAMGASDRGSL
jgi:4-amino-4-deoxy-L-arabinose transferase-like glycosyltransferase